MRIPCRFLAVVRTLRRGLRALASPITRRLHAIRRRTTNLVVKCGVCNRPVMWEEEWYRDPVTDIFYCQRCRPEWSKRSELIFRPKIEVQIDAARAIAKLQRISAKLGSLRLGAWLN